MPIDVIMPQMGESIAEGTLVKWLKKPGDKVQRDENLFEISTDKVDAEIPSPASGILGEILVQENQTVEVGTVVARLLQEGEVAGGGGTTAQAPAGEAEAPPAAEAQPDGAPSVRSRPPGEDRWAAPEPATAEPVDAGEGDGKGSRLPTKSELRRQRSSPLVRNIAAEHGVDLSEVQGTGLSGRVTKRDILAYVESAEAAPAERPAPVERPAAAEEPAAERSSQPIPPEAPVAPAAGLPPAAAVIEPAAVAAMGATPRPFGDQDRVEVV